MTTTTWTCLGNLPTTPPCGAGGTYDHTAIGGDSGDAWKHTKVTTHATTTRTTKRAAGGAG